MIVHKCAICQDSYAKPPLFSDSQWRVELRDNTLSIHYNDEDTQDDN